MSKDCAAHARRCAQAVYDVDHNPGAVVGVKSFKTREGLIAHQLMSNYIKETHAYDAEIVESDSLQNDRYERPTETERGLCEIMRDLDIEKHWIDTRPYMNWDHLKINEENTRRANKLLLLDATQEDSRKHRIYANREKANVSRKEERRKIIQQRTIE